MNECRPFPTLQRSLSLLLVALFLALALTLLLAVVGHAARSIEWRATEFQVQNLDDETAALTARFYAPDGTEVLSFTESIAPGMAVYYQPESTYGLPTQFTGTLWLESEQNVAAAIVHFAEPVPPYHNGVTAHEMLDESEAGLLAFAPLVEKENGGFSSHIGISNLGDQAADVTVRLYDAPGEVAATLARSVARRGYLELDVAALGGVPAGFVGSASVLSDQPVLVSVHRSSGVALASYGAAAALQDAPLAPLTAILPTQTASITTTVTTQNPGDELTVVAQAYGDDCETAPCRVLTLKSNSSDHFVWPNAEGQRLYAFNSNQEPVAAVVTVESDQPDGAGTASYGAFQLSRLGNQAAAPLLYGGYNGWHTRVWVQNLGTTSATVLLTHTLLPTGTQVPLPEAVVGAGQTVVFPPPLAVHAAAVIRADQPIAVLIEGYNYSLGSEDSRFYYRGTPFGPPLPGFASNSPQPLGETIYYENTTVGLPPVRYAWNLGDGIASQVKNPAHTYPASGAYSVILTATNLYGSATVSDVVQVQGSPRAGFTSSSPDNLGETTTFANTSSGLPAITGYQWDLGDGATSTEEHPQHTYEEQGLYYVVLTATNAAGSDVFIGRVLITDFDLVYLPLILKNY